MKSTLLEVLMDLFHHYLEEKTLKLADINELLEELQNFNRKLDLKPQASGLNESGEIDLTEKPSLFSPSATRLYTDYEKRKLSLECRGFLVLLEQARLITGPLREAIIYEALQLKMQTVDLEELKPIILNLLAENINDEIELAWLQHIMLSQNHALIKH